MADMKVSLYPHQRVMTSSAERYVCYKCGEKNFDSARFLCARSRHLRRNMYLIETRSHSLKRRDERLKDIREKLRQAVQNLATSGTSLDRGDFKVTDSHFQHLTDGGINADIKTECDTTTGFGKNIGIRTEENVEGKFEMNNESTVTESKESSLDSGATAAVCDDDDIRSGVTTIVCNEDEVSSKGKHYSCEKRMSMRDISQSSSLKSNSNRSPASTHYNRYGKESEPRALTVKATIENTPRKTSIKHWRPAPSARSAVCHNSSSFHRFSPRRMSIRRQRRHEARPTRLHEHGLSPQKKSPSKPLTRVMRLAQAVIRAIPARTGHRKIDMRCADFGSENSPLERCAN